MADKTKKEDVSEETQEQSEVSEAEETQEVSEAEEAAAPAEEAKAESSDEDDSAGEEDDDLEDEDEDEDDLFDEVLDDKPAAAQPEASDEDDDEDWDDEDEDDSDAEDDDDLEDDDDDLEGSETSDDEDDDEEWDDEDEDLEDDSDAEDDEDHALVAHHGHDHAHDALLDELDGADAKGLKGVAVYFYDPHELMDAAYAAKHAGYKKFDAYSPFPIHGMDDAVGGRSWMPWVTFFAGGTGFLTANALQFGTLTFDWPMIIGGKPHAPWPSFVPVMFELTVLIGGVTSALVMFIAAGCFRRPKIIDRQITNDRFVLWLDAEDEGFDMEATHAFAKGLHPYRIRPVYEYE